MKIPFAPIHLKENNSPISEIFDDIYFDIKNGIEESSYVFFKQNNIEERFSFHDQENKQFTIIETGFGTGLNFLLALQLYIKKGYQFPLHYISFEAYPIKPKDLETILIFDSLKAVLPLFIQKYQELMPTHYPETKSVSFSPFPVKLQLFFGNITNEINKLNDFANAWFLDGHSPNKNPEMWSTPLFQSMADHSLTGSTLATFTAAGFVRRNLSSVGFKMEKIRGFGNKREMLRGTFS